jgi:hypothetical protein
MTDSFRGVRVNVIGSAKKTLPHERVICISLNGSALKELSPIGEIVEIQVGRNSALSDAYREAV